MIELLITLIMTGAIHDFNLIPNVDYDPIEVIYFSTLTPETTPE